MSDTPRGPDWEKGSDGKWYAPGVLSGAGWWVAADGVWYPGSSNPGSASPPPVSAQPQLKTGPTFGDHMKKVALMLWAAFRRLPARTQAIFVGVAGVVILVLIVISVVTAPDAQDDNASVPTETTTTSTSPPAEVTEAPDPTTTTAEGPSADIELSQSSVSVEDATSVDISGSTAPGTTLSAEWDNGNATVTAGPQGNFTLTIDGLDTEGVVEVSLTSEAPGGDTAEASVSVTRTISENTFKFFTRRIPYDELVRDPNALIGETVNYRAEVFQYDSVTSTAAMLVSVTDEDFGFWTDNVLVTLDPALGANIDNDDIIDIWGTVTGAQTYETAIGGSNTVPTVDARYMTLVEKQ